MKYSKTVALTARFAKPHRLAILIVVAVLIAPGLAAGNDAADAGDSSPPNIIYIMIDDAGYGDLGGETVATPAFNRLCDEGIRFTQHYSGSAVCAPTRCVLMTGLHTGHCRRRDNTATGNLDQLAGRPLIFLEPEDVTLAETLQQAGYTTVGIGKWGLGNPGSTGEPGKQGFDHWFGYLDQVHAHDQYSDHLWHDGREIAVPGNAGNKKDTYIHDLFERETLKFIREPRQKPFLLYLAYTLPHGDYVISQEDPAYGLYADKPWPQMVKNYAAMITRVDRTMGLLLDELEAQGLQKRTIVFYTSDNGPNAPFVKTLHSAGGLRGTKRELYEGGVRASMAVRWTGQIPAGRTSDAIWSMVDLFPTACELAGIQPPANLDGTSIVPALLGKPQPPRDPLYWEIHHPFQQAVRDGHWKAIRFGTADAIELYDLRNDPAELKNLANDHPEVSKRLSGVMDAEHSDDPFFPTVRHAKKPQRR